MFSEEKINRVMIILTCVILLGGLYYEHSMLKLKAGLKSQEERVSQKKIAVRSHSRKRSSIEAKKNVADRGRMLSLKITPEPGNKNIYVSIEEQHRSPGLSSSLKAFKNYTRSLESKPAGDL